MESSQKTVNTTPKQYEMLVDYMSAHPDLAKGYLKNVDARKKSFVAWQNLAKDLNAEGPPMRDGVGWKKVWADFKVHTKAKMRKNKINISGTGGGPSRQYALSSIEEKVIELLDLNQAIEGMSQTLNFGVNIPIKTNSTSESQSADLMTEEEEPPSCSRKSTLNESIMPTCSSNLNPKNRRYLLEKQVENQINYQTNSFNALNKINENLERIVKYKRKGLELKEDQYKLKKENFELKKRTFELKKEKFEFKKTKTLEETKEKIKQLELKKEILKLKHACNASSKLSESNSD